MEGKEKQIHGIEIKEPSDSDTPWVSHALSDNIPADKSCHTGRDYL